MQIPSRNRYSLLLLVLVQGLFVTLAFWVGDMMQTRLELAVIGVVGAGLLVGSRVLGQRPPVPGGDRSGVAAPLAQVSADQELTGSYSETIDLRFFEAVPDGLLVVDSDDRIRFCNHAAACLFNRSANQLTGRPVRGFLDIDRATRVSGRISRLVREGMPDCYIEVETARFDLDRNEPSRLFFVRDVTQRYLASREHRLLRACMAQIEDTVLITEAHPLDSPGPKVVFANEALERTTGFPPEALLGRSPRILQGEGTDPAARRRIRRALEQGEPVCETVLNYTVTGEAFWNQVNIVPITFQEEGETFFCSVQRDISEQLAREQRLRQLNVAMEEAVEQERRRVARDLHDELGQLLSAIKLDLGRIRRTQPGDEINALLDGAGSTIEQAIAQVRSIATQLRPSSLDDLGFVAAARWLVEKTENRLDVPVRWNGPSTDLDLPLPIATALFRILQEALTNIGRYAQASYIEVRFRSLGDRVELEVQDDGNGFDTSRAQRGSGLGLMGMKERAESHQGRLQIESAPGEGCLLTAVMPLPGGSGD